MRLHGRGARIWWASWPDRKADFEPSRIPYTMAKFVVYEKVVEAVYKRVDKKQTSDAGQTGINLGAGLVAGCAAAIVSQPADTMLSKINKTKGLPGEGTISRLIKIGGELGLRGSFSGIGARLVMVGTLTAGQFAIYGDIKKMLGECWIVSGAQ